MQYMEVFIIISLPVLLSATYSPLNGTIRHSLTKRQSAYICGVEPYRFYSDVPCNYYAICINGGMRMNIGCTSDSTCKLYDPTYVCIQDCCCTTPQVRNPTLPPIPFNRGQRNCSTYMLAMVVFAFFVLHYL
uniref:Chitin-binding type-2 domain-containing protein n=1 Tax=Parascaris univalens TaxID=6257 RepID=A0A915AU91_PARUN